MRPLTESQLPTSSRVESGDQASDEMPSEGGWSETSAGR